MAQGGPMLSWDTYADKVYAGWLGKNIGGTLGGPLEGRKELLDLSFYTELPDGPLPNDDLDLQLVWLHALEQYGIRLTSTELGREWVDHIFYPWDEYGYSLANLRRGLLPPVAGWFNNPFTHCMGAPIRSEIWAMIAPGAPRIAAWHAYQDAVVDHAGGEGVWGEMFFAAIESAAFLDSDRDRLIRLGLDHIPPDCRVAGAVRDLLAWHRAGEDWQAARELILERHGSPNFTDAPQNIAFTVLGWLYGEDFGDALLKAVNCGYDTDCTGATLGAILGIIAGREGLPRRWVEPVGEAIAVSAAVNGFPAPATLDELTRRTLAIGRQIGAAWNLPLAGAPDGARPDSPTASIDAADPATLWQASPRANRVLLPLGTSANEGLEMVTDYGSAGPAIAAREQKTLSITLTNNAQKPWHGRLAMTVPAGWDGPPEHPFTLDVGEALTWQATIQSDARLMPWYELAVRVRRDHQGDLWSVQAVPFSLVAATHWTLYGPGEDGGRAVSCPGNRIDFAGALGSEEPGQYRAETTLVNPTARQVRLIVATSTPVKASLDDATVLEDHHEVPCLPAFHRGNKERRVELELAPGEYRLVIEVQKGTEPLDVWVLPVAAGFTKPQGPFFYLTDIVFAPV